MTSGIAALAAAATMLAGAGPAGAAGAASAASGAVKRSLYFVSGVNIKVVSVIGGTAHQVTKTGTDSVTGMTIASGKVFWVTLTGTDDKISFANKSGGSAHVLVNGLNAPRGLVFAGGWLFWVDQNAIGRVHPNGTDINRSFIKLPQEVGGGVADGLATDGHHLFFSRCQGHEIGRVDLTGAHKDLSFIKLTSAACPQGLGVGNSHVYWADLSGHVGRASLTGQNINGRWLNTHTAGEGPFNVAADNVHVFWDWGGAAGSPVHIGRSTIHGSASKKTFLTGQGAFALASPGANS